MSVSEQLLFTPPRHQLDDQSLHERIQIVSGNSKVAMAEKIIISTKPIGVRVVRVKDGGIIEVRKGATFWHMTSEGQDEANRTPDFRRCERIRWPRPVIENSEDSQIKWWVSVKRNEDRIHIWLEKEDYIVVLSDRKGFLLPWTAFLVNREHTRRKLKKEYEAYWKTRLQKG